MPKSTGSCAAILALVIAAAPGHTEPAKRAVPAVSEDCETKIQKLEASTAEGEERLAEKNAAIEVCAKQYHREKTIVALVKECAKYEEQPVVKQQLLAECQLAAYGYANALHALKAEYRK